MDTVISQPHPLTVRLQTLLPQPTPEEADVLRAQHPGALLKLVTGREGLCVVIHSPLPALAVSRYWANLVGPQHERALELLLRACLVFPEEVALREALKLRPGLVQSFGEQVLDLVGEPPGAEPVKRRCPRCGRVMERCPSGHGKTLHCTNHRPEALRFEMAEGGRLRPLGAAKRARGRKG